MGFPMGFVNFQKIDVFEKRLKNLRIRVHFRRSKRWKIVKQWCWKGCFFWTSNFERFFLRIFPMLARFWDVPGLQKSKTKLKNRVRDACGTRLRFLIVFGTVLGRFGEGFGRVLGGFRKDFWIFGGGILVKHFKLKNLLWWLGRRGADQ